MRFGIKTLLGVVLGYMPLFTLAQTAEVRSLGFFEGQEECVEIAELTNGGYVLAGTTNANNLWNTDVFVYTLNPDLSISWVTMLGDYGLNSANGVAVLQDGIAVLTTILSYDNAYQLRLYKLNFDGELIFTRDLGSSDWDFGKRVRAGNDGSIFLLAESYANQESGIQCLVYKLDEEGNIVWEKSLGDASNDIPADLAVDAGNNLFVLGTRMINEEGGQFQCWKFNADGSEAWYFNPGLTGSYFARAMCLYNNGVVATGHEITNQGNDKIILGVDDSGMLLWDRHYPLEGNQSLGGIAYTGDGFALAGESDTFGAGGWGVYVMKSDPNGWWNGAAVFGGAEDEKAYSLIVDSNSRILFAGETDSYGDGTRNAYLVRLPTNNVLAEYILSLEVLEQDSFTDISEKLTPPAQKFFLASQVPIIFHLYPELSQGTLLFNSQGRRVAEISDLESLEWHLQSLCSGMYFLTPISSDKTNPFRVFKP